MITPLFAYVGPETILPAMSILAAIGGLLLTCFSFVAAPFKRAFAALTGRTIKEPEQTPTGPTSTPN
jgi:hypothetical protein